MIIKRTSPLVQAIIIIGLVLPVSSQPAPAAPEGFGSGIAVCTNAPGPRVLTAPRVVSDCTRQGLQDALNAAGEIVFDCAESPVIIPVDQTLELSTTADTIIDGGHLVTLDGGGNTRIFHKDWHNPTTIGTVRVTLQNIRLINGRAPGEGGTEDHSGGAIAAGHPGTTLELINVTFEDNHTTDIHVPDNQGGAVFLHNSYEMVVSGSVFRGNTAGNGGAIGVIAAGMRIYNSIFENNQALDDYTDGIVRGYGGALHQDGVTNGYNPNSNHEITICGSVFDSNQAVRGGGGTSSVVSDAKNTLFTIDRTTFINNQVQGVPDPGNPGQYLFGQGGGVYHIEDDHAGGRDELNLLIHDSTFTQNQARRQGGGLWISILGKGDLSNSTIYANATSAPFNTVGQGGGMAITLGRIDITNVLFYKNHAAYQAGALHGGGSGDPDRVITLTNTVFVDNTLNEQSLPSTTEWQGYHTNRPMNDGGQNIQYPRLKPTYLNEVNNAITDNPIYADPLLGAIGWYGGSTQTVPLGMGSPAIDQAVSAACPALDQRGYERQGVCDIGPFEYHDVVLGLNERIYLPVILGDR